MLRASWILYTAHLRRTLFSKRALVCLLLVAAPVAAAILIASLASQWGAPPALELLWVLQIQLVVPLVSLLLGSAVVAEEVEDRTITYLFTRPIPRAALLLGRWLAAVTVAFLLLSVSSWLVIQLLSGAAAADAENAVGPALQTRLFQTVLLGAAAYSLFFAALGALIKHPVIVGLAYTFAIEGVFANIPGSSQGVTILYYLKSFLAGGDPELQGRLDELAAGVLLEPDQALMRLGLMMSAVLFLGGWTITRKQFVLPS